MQTARIGDATRAKIAAAWPALLDAFASGEVMAPHFERTGVTANQVRVWRCEDPARGRQWDEAREQSADAFAEQIVEVANNRMDDAAAARVRIQALQWIAGRRNALRYGDKAQLDVNMRTVDLTRIIDAANQRLIAARAAGQVVATRVIEHGAGLALPDKESIDDLL